MLFNIAKQYQYRMIFCQLHWFTNVMCQLFIISLSLKYKIHEFSLVANYALLISTTFIMLKLYKTSHFTVKEVSNYLMIFCDNFHEYIWFLIMELKWSSLHYKLLSNILTLFIIIKLKRKQICYRENVPKNYWVKWNMFGWMN